MKTSLSERVMRGNMPKGDLKETSIVCIVVNSLSRGDDSIIIVHGGRAT